MPDSTVAMPTANASVSRSLSGSRPIAPVLSQAVAEPPDSLQRSAAERAVYLLAEVAHIDVDDVGIAVVRHVPDVFDQHLSRQDDAGAPHEQLEQRELLGREGDGSATPANLVRGRVESQITYGQGGGSGCG